mgnify:CR=1 FL=1
MSVFYYSVVESGQITLGIALGVPVVLVCLGLFIDSYLPRN